MVARGDRPARVDRAAHDMSDKDTPDDPFGSTPSDNPFGSTAVGQPVRLDAVGQPVARRRAIRSRQRDPRRPRRRPPPAGASPDAMARVAARRAIRSTHRRPPPRPRAPRARSSALILGIVGIVFCPRCVLFAWVLGRKAEQQVDDSGGTLSGRGEATAGKVLGIVSCVPFGAVIALFIAAHRRRREHLDVLATCPGNSRRSVRPDWEDLSCKSGGFGGDVGVVGRAGGVVVRSGVAGRGAELPADLAALDRLLDDRALLAPIEAAWAASSAAITAGRRCRWTASSG